MRRPLRYIILGLVLCSAAGYLAYDVFTHPTETSTPSTYNYTVKQSLDSSIVYFSSSFYENKPAASNTAYVSSLTDTIKTSLKYDYTASRLADLTTSYSAVAKIYAKYTTGTDGKTTATVWSREYPLLKPVTDMKTTDHVSLSPEATLDFAEYRKDMERYKTSLAIPVTLEAQVVFVIRTVGVIDGASLDDIRTATMTVPLDQPLYVPAKQFEKETTKHITTKDAKNNQDMQQVYKKIAAGVLGVLGILSVVYGMRKQIFKSQYQRHLDKIYRLHDGIIVRTKHPVDVSDSKVVPMRSFDDMLNLEEELKTPIIANEISSTVTEFIIASGGVVYRYTLSDDQSATRATAAHSATRVALRAPREDATVTSPSNDEPERAIRVRKTIKIEEPSLEDVVAELDKKPHHSRKK